MKADTTGRRRPIYVESLIRAPIERVWDATQQPDQHQRWDVRFGAISYLPPSDGEPQRFTYATTVAPGFTITGHGRIARRPGPLGRDTLVRAQVLGRRPPLAH